MKMRYTLLLLLALGASAFSQQKDIQYTGGLTNGRFWQSESGDERDYFILGIHEAEAFITKDEKWWTPGFTVGEYRKEIDDVYTDTENINIPVVWVFRYCAGKLRGDVPKANLNQMLSNFRKTSNSLIMK